MLYLLLVADSFDESVEEEIGKSRIIDQTHNAIVADITKTSEKKLRDCVFIYNYFPISSKSKIGSGAYKTFLKGEIKRLAVDKNSRLKLEVYNINCRKGESAKDLEVSIGQSLEKEGYNIDIVTAQVLAYCVLLNGVCYSGKVELSGVRKGFIDPFRKYKEKLISRAEFKIMEAFDAFGIKTPRLAIDIGAAPGGWSLFLARRGSAVIAVDNAELDAVRIRKAGVVLKVSKAAVKSPKNGSIMHLKSNALGALALLKGIKADLLADDINAGGIVSSSLVLKYAMLLEKDASLVMTVKCVHRKVRRYMKEVEVLLRPSFRIVGWKVLPHNRQEITLYAIKK